MLGAMFYPRTPVLFIDLSGGKKLLRCADFLKGLAEIRLTTLILLPEGAKEKFPESEFLKYIHSNDREKALEAADFTLVCGKKMSEVSCVGCVPIAAEDGDSTVDFNPLQETGNGFYFAKPTKWEMFAAVVRARETYQFPYDWENLVKKILNS